MTTSPRVRAHEKHIQPFESLTKTVKYRRNFTRYDEIVVKSKKVLIHNLGEEPKCASVRFESPIST